MWNYSLITFLLLLLVPTATASNVNKVIKIAVLDTGLNLNDPRFNICESGHEDFTGEGIVDVLGHGTHVAGLIQEYAKDSSYCLIILKYYAENNDSNVSSYMKALRKAVFLKVDIVNISGGGPTKFPGESNIIRTARNIKFIVAAGNEDKNIDITPYYPASFKFNNVIAVGSLRKDGFKAASSNYGSRVVWELGENLNSTLPHGYGKLSGTSMATAVHSGKVVKEMYDKHY